MIARVVSGILYFNQIILLINSKNSKDKVSDHTQNPTDVIIFLYFYVCGFVLSCMSLRALKVSRKKSRVSKIRDFLLSWFYIKMVLLGTRNNA